MSVSLQRYTVDIKLQLYWIKKIYHTSIPVIGVVGVLVLMQTRYHYLILVLQLLRTVCCWTARTLFSLSNDR